MKFTICLRQIQRISRPRNIATQAKSANGLGTLEKYSAFNPTALSLQHFIDFGCNSSSDNAKANHSFCFLRQELPVRLANIMQEFNHIPNQLRNMPSIQVVQGWYMKSFEDLMVFEAADGRDENVLQNFTDALDIIRNRHGKVVETMAQGVLEMIEVTGDSKTGVDGQMQYFLDRFYMSRISIRMLIHQHLLLFAPTLASHPRHIGSIDPRCDVLNIAEDAFENARFLCEQYYLASPDVNFKCMNAFEGETMDRIEVCYVPSHLYHILFELLKNSLRAVVEYHGEKLDLPKIDVLIVKGNEDLTVKISDQGGGIRRTEIDLLFNYMYSTAPRPPSPAAASSTPLAGYGYGLPLSRLYAKYFNGDLWLSSVEGYGTDAMIYLKVFPTEASELLPVYNKTSEHKYSMSVPVGDWSDPSQTSGLHGAYHSTRNPNNQSRSFSTSSRLNNKPRLVSSGILGQSTSTRYYTQDSLEVVKNAILKQ